MFNINSFIRVFAIIISFIPFSLNGQELSQNVINWITEYISCNSSKTDASVPSMKIYNYYINANDSEKLVLEDRIYHAAISFIKQEKFKLAISAINLYEILPIKDQSPKPELNFMRGYCSAFLNDSIMLKSEINKLKDIPNTTFYTSILYQYLKDLRKTNYLSDLSGYWVSDILYKSGKYLHYNYTKENLPKYIFKINEIPNSIDFWLERRSQFNTQICNLTRGNFPEDIKSELIVPFASDSIYVLWSSEKLENFNVASSTFLRQSVSNIASSLAGEFNQRHKYSVSEKIAGDLIVGLGEIGINALLDELFKPSKEIFLLEARLRKVNDNILTGKLYFQQTKVKAGEEIKWEKYIDTVSMLRWRPEYDIIFMMRTKKWPLMPYYDNSKDVPSQIESLKEDIKQQLKASVDKKKSIGINYFLRNDSLIINYVIPKSPANKSGLKNGDCILSINNTPVTGVKCSLNEIHMLCDGEPKSTIRLKVISPASSKAKDVLITRDKFKITDDYIDYVYKIQGYENLIIPYWKDVRDDTTGQYGKEVLKYNSSNDKETFQKEYNTRMINELLKHCINNSSRTK